MQITLKLIALVAPLLLTACSEGSGSGSILGSLLNENAGKDSASGVEAGVGNQVDQPQQDFVLSLDDLIGTVNMTYRFNLDEGEYFNTITFSEESRFVNEDGGNALLTADAIKEHYCQTLLGTTGFLCVTLTRETQSLELFFFPLGANGQGRGTYEFCYSNEDPEACGEDLATDPDGTVDVAVNAAVAARRATSRESNSITVDTDMHKRVSNQADSPEFTSPATDAEKVLADEISQAMKRMPARQ